MKIMFLDDEEDVLNSLSCVPALIRYPLCLEACLSDLT